MESLYPESTDATLNSVLPSLIQRFNRTEALAEKVRLANEIVTICHNAANNTLFCCGKNLIIDVPLTSLISRARMLINNRSPILLALGSQSLDNELVANDNSFNVSGIPLHMRDLSGRLVDLISQLSDHNGLVLPNRIHMYHSGAVSNVLTQSETNEIFYLREIEKMSKRRTKDNLKILKFRKTIAERNDRLITMQQTLKNRFGTDDISKISDTTNNNNNNTPPAVDCSQLFGAQLAKLMDILRGAREDINNKSNGGNNGERERELLRLYNWAGDRLEKIQNLLYTINVGLNDTSDFNALLETVQSSERKMSEERAALFQQLADEQLKHNEQKLEWERLEAELLGKYERAQERIQALDSLVAELQLNQETHLASDQTRDTLYADALEQMRDAENKNTLLGQRLDECTAQLDNESRLRAQYEEMLGDARGQQAGLNGQYADLLAQNDALAARCTLLADNVATHNATIDASTKENQLLRSRADELLVAMEGGQRSFDARLAEYTDHIDGLERQLSAQRIQSDQTAEFLRNAEALGAENEVLANRIADLESTLANYDLATIDTRKAINQCMEKADADRRRANNDFMDQLAKVEGKLADANAKLSECRNDNHTIAELQRKNAELERSLADTRSGVSTRSSALYSAANRINRMAVQDCMNISVSYIPKGISREKLFAIMKKYDRNMRIEMANVETMSDTTFENIVGQIIEDGLQRNNLAGNIVPTAEVIANYIQYLEGLDKNPTSLETVPTLSALVKQLRKDDFDSLVVNANLAPGGQAITTEEFVHRLSGIEGDERVFVADARARINAMNRLAERLLLMQ